MLYGCAKHSVNALFVKVYARCPVVSSPANVNVGSSGPDKLVRAQTSASTRSGEYPAVFLLKSEVKAHIWSSNSGKLPTCDTRLCSYNALTGSARVDFPRLACTILTGTFGST
jgi:hypothetical protein